MCSLQIFFSIIVAESAVPTFKEQIKKFSSSKEHLNVFLANFLFHNRCTPHSVTGISPALLFLGRELRNRLDLLKPKSVTDHKKSKPNVGPRKYDVGDAVLVRDYANPDRPVWVQGVILKCVTSIIYLVKVNDYIWKRHIDQKPATLIKARGRLLYMDSHCPWCSNRRQFAVFSYCSLFKDI